jgi:hypothetical protein
LSAGEGFWFVETFGGVAVAFEGDACVRRWWLLAIGVWRAWWGGRVVEAWGEGFALFGVVVVATDWGADAEALDAEFAGLAAVGGV